MLIIHNITKRYKDILALDHVSVSSEKGQVLGLLGPNGSGKTTLLKILSGILPYDGGSVTLDDAPMSVATKGRIAFLPENNQFYEWMTVKDAVGFYGYFYDDFDAGRYRSMSGDLKLNEQQKVNTLSKGVYQQFRICLTLSREARLYLLDEPLNGIDVLARDRIVAAIRHAITPHNTILITSHLIRDIERILDRVCFIRDGSILLEGDCEQLRLNKKQSIENCYKEVMAGE